MQEITRALTFGDAIALCRLADPNELKKLALTPEKVRSFLQETLWEGGLPRMLIIVPLKDATNEGAYIWNVRKDVSGSGRSVTVTILWSGVGKPRLVLSSLLRSTAIAQTGKVRDGSASYAEKALRLGIEGLRGGKGEYYGRDHLERSISRATSLAR